MAEDKEISTYYENMEYGKDAKASEIHGKVNQVIINEKITEAVHGFDKAKEAGDNAKANMYESFIKSTSIGLDNIQGKKEEHAMNYQIFSDFFDPTWDKMWNLELGEIGFAPEDLSLTMSCMMPNGEVVVKKNKDIAKDWVVKGTEEPDFMKMQQDAVKQSNSIGQPLDFDVDYAVDKWLEKEDSWKIAFADLKVSKSPSNPTGYFLHSYISENEEAIASGEITDEMLAPESFNPEFDTRLATHYSEIIKRSFNPNYQSAKEAQEADELIAQNNNGKENNSI